MKNTGKNLRILKEDHKWLMLQRALTDIPATQQIHNLIEKEKDNVETKKSKQQP